MWHSVLKLFPLFNCACTVFSWYGACFGYQLTLGLCVLPALLDQITAMTDWSFFYLFVSDAVTTLNPFTYWIDLNISSSLTSFLLAAMNLGGFKHFWSRLVFSPDCFFKFNIISNRSTCKCLHKDRLGVLGPSWALEAHLNISCQVSCLSFCQCDMQYMVIVLWGT